MPTELEELVGFLHHGNTQIRQIAVENLVPYSKSQPDIFKAQQLAPITDLKLLVKDYPPIAKNVLTILVNISSDQAILKALAEDDAFLETLLLRVTNAQEPNADLLAMLLANLAKSPSLARLLTLNRAILPSLSPSPLAITQLLALFNTGITGNYNKNATYDYLAYLFADLAKYPSFQTYLTTSPSPSPPSPSPSPPSPSTPTSPTPSPQPPPLTTLLPHTTHPHRPPRLGTALLLRNLLLTLPPPALLSLLHPPISLLPALLLPLCSADQSNISAEEMELLPEECQYLTVEESREERDMEVVGVFLEGVWLMVARGEGVGAESEAGKGEEGKGNEVREFVVGNGGYVVVREGHMRWTDEGVRAGAERVVDVLMAGEGDKLNREGKSLARNKGVGGKNIGGSGLPNAKKAEEIPMEASGSSKESGEDRTVEDVTDADDDEDEDNAIVPIF